MALEKISTITGRAVTVPGNDIDTDRIIPARFLKCVTFDALGEGLFADDRKAAEGQHPLDNPIYAGASILLGGANFGCGSSREHAPQAIKKFGFRAVVAESFAEIFFGNATNIGLACVNAARADIQTLSAAIAADPTLELTVDLAAQQIRFGERSVPLTMREAARDALINGRWDPIAELLEGSDAVGNTAAGLPYVSGW
ncbi:isopropylmalate isomerase [Cephaloticoccus primus]|uniref:3-isopropylmalate dehydratase n=1 Tax=Cephaloticoccus primus TaxID=1548207 RepID=A0A139SMP0_9BACT|nr:3-isopropylmalate dehydratase small subunit [Cephaloticoccus primus]KXU35863.1 isopropylmalate isomerase [Cephaloticoccus primus]